METKHKIISHNIASTYVHSYPTCVRCSEVIMTACNSVPSASQVITYNRR